MGFGRVSDNDLLNVDFYPSTGWKETIMCHMGERGARPVKKRLRFPKPFLGQRIKVWTSGGVEKVYFYMHQHEELHSPELSKYLRQELYKHCGTTVSEPIFANEMDRPQTKKIKNQAPIQIPLH